MAEKLNAQTIRRVGNYDLLEKVGQGGMSTVFKGRDARTQAIVAVKIASRAVINDPFASRRFELEYEVVQYLDHPHLAKVLDHGKCNDIPYLVMEYVDGLSLMHRLRNEGCLDEAVALPMLMQVADALAYLHARQIIHRDVKPGNILLNSQGQAKLCDMGLSKNLDATTELTRSRIGLGTLQFASPEQFDDARSVDARSDIYSLAATLYLALTGEPPFGLGGPLNVLKRKLQNEFEPPARKNPQIRTSVDAAIRLGLHAERNCRPASCREFMALLTGARAIPTSIELPGSTAAEGAAPTETATSASDRRAGIRYATELESECRPMLGSSQQRWAATIKDISTTGICLCVPRRFEAGNILDLLFALQPDGSMTSQLVRVRWIRAAEANSWLLGGEFLSPLSQEELDSFFDERMNRTQQI